jgi:hypothetical protein
MKHNYDAVIHYLELAHRNCGSSNESENLKKIIRSLISNFDKLIIKNKRRVDRKLSEAKTKQFTYPQPEETLKLIEKLIETEKGKSNEIIDN